MWPAPATTLTNGNSSAEIRITPSWASPASRFMASKRSTAHCWR